MTKHVSSTPTVGDFNSDACTEVPYDRVVEPPKPDLSHYSPDYSLDADMTGPEDFAGFGEHAA